MIATPNRGGLNWDLNGLDQNPSTFERTIFKYGGTLYIGWDMLNDLNDQ